MTARVISNRYYIQKTSNMPREVWPLVAFYIRFLLSSFSTSTSTSHLEFLPVLNNSASSTISPVPLGTRTMVGLDAHYAWASSYLHSIQTQRPPQPRDRQAKLRANGGLLSIEKRVPPADIADQLTKYISFLWCIQFDVSNLFDSTFFSWARAPIEYANGSGGSRPFADVMEYTQLLRALPWDSKRLFWRLLSTERSCRNGTISSVNRWWRQVVRLLSFSEECAKRTR